MAEKRLTKERKDLLRKPPSFFAAAPVGNDILRWHATLKGPPEIPYAGGVFLLDINFSADYPFVPPEVTFRTKIYHPNISRSGILSIDALKEDWTASSTIHKVMLSISSLLADPKCDSALEPEIANVYKSDQLEYQRTARSWTHNYAVD